MKEKLIFKDQADDDPKNKFILDNGDEEHEMDEFMYGDALHNSNFFSKLFFCWVLRVIKVEKLIGDC